MTTGTVSVYVLANATSLKSKVVIINKNMLGKALSFTVQLTGFFQSARGSFLFGEWRLSG